MSPQMYDVSSRAVVGQGTGIVCRHVGEELASNDEDDSRRQRRFTREILLRDERGGGGAKLGRDPAFFRNASRKWIMFSVRSFPSVLLCSFLLFSSLALFVLSSERTIARQRDSG